MSDSSVEKKSAKILPSKAAAPQVSKRAASAEERRAKRTAALDGQQAELKLQAQARREARGVKTG
jgi:hypothetical protein